MKTIYLDSEFKCHLTNDGTMAEIETDFFDDKCDTFIEGYRFVPAGKTWIRYDGAVFHGGMVAPWKDYAELDAAQRQYERQLLEEYQSENSEYELMQLELITSYAEGVNSI